VTDQITFRNRTRSVRPIVRHRFMQTEMADAESMFALGQKRPFCDAGAMSALPPKSGHSECAELFADLNTAAEFAADH
ncbi:MAG: hypothetical protein WA366_01755, partial [Pseudolabrys sp.]